MVFQVLNLTPHWSKIMLGDLERLVRPGKGLNGREKNSGEEKSRRRRRARLTFLRPNFFLTRLDFSPSPLTAPGSPRMVENQLSSKQIDLPAANTNSCKKIFQPIRTRQMLSVR